MLHGRLGREWVGGGERRIPEDPFPRPLRSALPSLLALRRLRPLPPSVNCAAADSMRAAAVGEAPRASLDEDILDDGEASEDEEEQVPMLPATGEFKYAL